MFYVIKTCVDFMINVNLFQGRIGVENRADRSQNTGKSSLNTPLYITTRGCNTDYVEASIENMSKK